MTIHRFKTSLLSAALAIGIAGQAQAQPVQEQQLTFALPAMPLGDALRTVARQSGRNLVVDDQLVAGRTAPALSGRFLPEEAVQRLLAGSGLTSRTIEGTFVISGPSTGVAADRAADADQEIVVTGSHIRGAPPTSPVITLNRKQIDESGVTSVEDFMRRLPQNVSAGVDQENFGVAGTGSDITQFGAGINLRGLGQRATLVLINGRRVAPSDTGAFVDVSLIPISAIERIEVLTDGASAIYGSDAVGGVVNFIFRNDFKGVEPVVQAGTTTEGGGRQLLAGLTAGGTWTGGRALLSYEYRDDEPIKARTAISRSTSSLTGSSCPKGKGTASTARCATTSPAISRSTSPACSRTGTRSGPSSMRPRLPFARTRTRVQRAVRLRSSSGREALG